DLRAALTQHKREAEREIWLEQSLRTGTVVGSGSLIARNDVAPPMVTRRALAAAAIVAAVALGVTYLLGRLAAAPAVTVKTHLAVSVVIADFENKTGDAVFDGTIEPALAGNLERTSFINTVARPKAARFDEQAARLASIRDGNDFVVSGSIETEPR